MTGLIGVIAQETSRFSAFNAALTELENRPPVKWILGHDIAENTNRLVDAMYEREADWLWILGDDHVFSHDVLDRLLAADGDIVVPLCLQRNPPYEPVVYTGFLEGLARRPIELAEPQYQAGGVIQIHSAGTAGMLVYRRVFDALERPWFESGKLTPAGPGEDLYFCDKARAAGFTLVCDLDVPFGHCQTSTIWPVREPDGWTYAFQWVGGLEITMPPARAWTVARRLAAGQV